MCIRVYFIPTSYKTKAETSLVPRMTTPSANFTDFAIIKQYAEKTSFNVNFHPLYLRSSQDNFLL
ncbi:hypothetical protein BLOT_006813 [Blomia tropicalis]|nr:hypothetical protein BLOT_006813 [Blomia tropicalis]